MNYCTQNPFESVTIGQKPKAKASDARDRWSTLELKRLFDSAEYRASDDDFKWVTLLMLHSGLRPSEACQLRISDIKSVNDSTYIAISEGGQGQRLKNINAVREVPIHANLLKRGFMAFVASRAHQNGQLFGYKQVGQTEDWSYQYCKQLSTLQTKIGMKPNARPTAYSFRHTFIDSMKQLDISEHIVAQLVGHANPNITYSRYGKDINVSSLSQYIAKLTYDI